MKYYKTIPQLREEAAELQGDIDKLQKKADEIREELRERTATIRRASYTAYGQGIQGLRGPAGCSASETLETLTENQEEGVEERP